MTKMIRLFLMGAALYYTGWKTGQKDKMRELTGEEPCIIEVGGEQKVAPQSACDAIARMRSLFGSDTGNPYA